MMIAFPSTNVAIFEIKQNLSLLYLSKKRVPRKHPSYDILLHERIIHRFSYPRCKQPTLVSWFLPPSGRLKLNVDAAYSHGRAGGGGIIRNSKGNVIVAFDFPHMDSTSPLHAEVLALAFVLNWCDAHYQLLDLFEMDSQIHTSPPTFYP